MEEKEEEEEEEEERVEKVERVSFEEPLLGRERESAFIFSYVQRHESVVFRDEI